MRSLFVKFSTTAMVLIATTTTAPAVSAMLLLKPDQQTQDNPIVQDSVQRSATQTPCETTSDCPAMKPCTFSTATKSFLRFGGRSLSSPCCGVQLVCIDNYCSPEQPAETNPLVDPMPINVTSPFVQVGTTFGGECSDTVLCPVPYCETEPCPEISCIEGVCTLSDVDIATSTLALPAVLPTFNAQASMTAGVGGAAAETRRQVPKRHVVPVQGRGGRPPKGGDVVAAKNNKTVPGRQSKRPVRTRPQPKKSRPSAPVAAPARKTLFGTTP
jgi:hypothetical protein